MDNNFKVIGSLEDIQKDLMLVEKFNRLDGKQIKVLFDDLQTEMRGINTVLGVENQKQKNLLQESFKANRDLLKEINKLTKQNHVLERKLDERNT